ncbi:ankyrin repeat domain-containing protein [Myxococcus stipitatus]|uniref:ankyrin repeat domain-containing protein n=1 Tax=Myxococcus stipitatus TaxID=83455 RepID=UPI0030CA8E83
MKPVLVRVLSAWILAGLVLGGAFSARAERREVLVIREVSPLQAASDGDAVMMKAVIDRKFDLNQPGGPMSNHRLMTPLMVASEKGHAGIVRMLLKAKADLDLRVPRHSASWPPYGWSARCFARSGRKPSPEKLLVQVGASGDEACLEEADFLAAVRRQDVKRTLQLGRRAKGRLQERVLKAALDQAIKDKSLAMLRAVDAVGFNPNWSISVELPVAPGTDVSMRPGSRIRVSASSPAQKAMDSHDEKTLLALVKAGEKPPMLMMMVRWGMTSVVLHQLQQGANPDTGEHAGNTPLIEAVLARNQVLVDALLAAGANVNLPGEVEVTPLLAALRGDKPVELGLVERLLDAKADINLADRTRTPLMDAASRCLPKAVALLLKRGARWDVPPDGGAGLYEEAVVPQVPCSEKVTAQVLQALREGGVPLQHPDETHLDWLRVRAAESQMLGPQLYAAGLRPPSKAQPPLP